jgi:membrane fusion protein, multidrug efflux system
MSTVTDDLDRDEHVRQDVPVEPASEDHGNPDGQDHGESSPPPEKSLLRRHPRLATTSLFALVVALAGGALFLDYTGHFESTDDAFIAARQFGIAPKVSGYLTAVAVTDNQHVGANDIIARIDERDYRVALAQAHAQMAAAKASIENVDAQLSVQRAQVAASQAQLQLSQAKLVFARQSSVRYETLAKEGWSSQQTGELAESNLYQQQAAVATAQSNLTVAKRQIASLEAQRQNALASLKQARAQRDQAQLNLSYTTVTAAQPGRVVQLSGAVGEYAQAGANLSMFVPDKIWVVANFKENQIDAMRPGDPAALEIDAYPEREFHGHVASVQPGSGTAFSLLPAENATGNYVKIVQRVPVKIVLDDPPTDVALGPGMSVVPTVRVDARPSLFERLTSWL